MGLRRLTCSLLVVGCFLATLTLAQYDDLSPPTSIVAAAAVSSPNSWLLEATTTTSSADVFTTTSSKIKNKFPSNFGDVKVAHAVLGAVAFLFIFPLGGIIIKVWDYRHIAWIHAAIQTFALAVFGACTGLGVWMAMKVHAVSHLHSVLGMVVLGLLATQPLMKLHFFDKRIPRIVHLVHMHLWFGRALLTLGIIDGGLGFQSAASLHAPQWAMGWKIAYGVVAAIVWIVYISVVMVWAELNKTGTRGGGIGNGNGKQQLGSGDDTCDGEEMAALSQNPGLIMDTPDVENAAAPAPARPPRPDDAIYRANGAFRSSAL